MPKKLSETTVETIEKFKQTIHTALGACTSLEEAAQKFTNRMFEEFEDSLMLVRLYVTIPYGTLSDVKQHAVIELADREGIRSYLHEKTPVLTLLGTSGIEEAHHDRLRLKQYAGIPLVSPEFVNTNPMIAQLLKALGFKAEWDQNPDTVMPAQDIETKTIGFLAGVFYVPDARHAVDAQGKKILSTLDQSAAYNPTVLSAVETIFGIGGAYINGPFIAAVFFSNEHLERNLVEEFMPLANYFKTTTIKLVLNDKFFA